MEPVKENSHKVLIIDADGGRKVYEADEIKICVPTFRCIKFWATFVACLLGVGIGMFFMLFAGAKSDYFPIGNSILTLAIGVLIPGPEYEAIVPKKVTSAKAIDDSAEEKSVTIDDDEDKHHSRPAPLYGGA